MAGIEKGEGYFTYIEAIGSWMVEETGNAHRKPPAIGK